MTDGALRPYTHPPPQKKPQKICGWEEGGQADDFLTALNIRKHTRVFFFVFVCCERFKKWIWWDLLILNLGLLNNKFNWNLIFINYEDRSLFPMFLISVVLFKLCCFLWGVFVTCLISNMLVNQKKCLLIWFKHF